MMIRRDGGELGRATQSGWWFQNRLRCLGSVVKALSWRTSGTSRRSEPLARLGPLPNSVWSFSAQEVRIFFSLNRSHTRLPCWVLPPVRMETLPWATCPVCPPTSGVLNGPPPREGKGPTAGLLAGDQAGETLLPAVGLIFILLLRFVLLNRGLIVLMPLFSEN